MLGDVLYGYRPPHFQQVAVAVGCSISVDSHHRVLEVHTLPAPVHRQGDLPQFPGVITD
jgi:hypothetical protein